MAFTNTFGPKVIAVGFNGNLHLAGSIAPALEYKGTWGSTGTKGEWLNVKTESMIHTPSSILDIEQSYRPTWFRLKSGTYKKGTKTIDIEPDDLVGISTDSLSDWTKDAQIFITTMTKQYTNRYDPQGLVPIYIDNDDSAQQKLNCDANKAFQQKFVIELSDIDNPPGANQPPSKMPDLYLKDEGVEVAKIDYIKTENNVTTIHLQSELEFDHISEHTTIREHRLRQV